MSLVRVTFFSEALTRQVNFVAILPTDRKTFDGNLNSKNKGPFKSLYLLHGVFDSENSWLTDTRIKPWAEDKNLAVFMPAGENSFYNDHTGIGDNFARFIGEELVNFTRAMFHLSDKREDTFVAGLSMGGYGALCTGLRYPQTFGYMGCFSSGLVIDGYPKNDDSHWILGKRSYFEAALGKEEQVIGSENDYRFLAKRNIENGIEIPKLYMCCGLQDDLLGVNRDYRDYLKSLNIDFDYFEDDGVHDWVYWDKHIYRFLEWLPL